MRMIQRSASVLSLFTLTLLGLVQPAPAQGPDFDLGFIDNMVIHHQGALDMAGEALKQGKRPELKTFANQVIKDQTTEIAQMKKWREAWYKGAPSARSEKIPGMPMTQGGGHQGMAGMSGRTAATYDVQFLDNMIAHHEGAIQMANEALTKAKRAEIKQLAQSIIRAQQAEIEQMKKWKAEWEKR